VQNLIGQLVPETVHWSEAFDDVTPVTLFPEEERVLANAVDKRRREFATVRRCAREALSQIGVRDTALLPGERGSPTWPNGVVGSMTHCAEYRAAAVGLASELTAIGIDAEPHEALPAGVLRAVASPGERAMLAQLPGPPGLAADRLLFSAKESLFKVWFPLTRLWLEFDEAEVQLDAAGVFTARLLTGPLPHRGRAVTELTGRWTATRKLLATAIVLS
jgi:4'-phosphopantetheinyl transferase EntD